MSILQYSAIQTAGTWEAEINVGYTTVYNAATNTTTVIFDTTSLAYWGKAGYLTHNTTTLTVISNDNPSSVGTTSLMISDTTNGAIKTFFGTPSPASVVVQHSSAEGAKSITIAASSSISAYNNSEQQREWSGQGSVTVQVGTRESGHVYIDNGTSFDEYQAYVDNGTSWEEVKVYVDNGTSWDLYS